MTGSQRPDAERNSATLAQLKCDIDAGLAGDKAGGFDPGAAPLGTDDEAAGDRLSPAAIAQARAEACAGARDSARANAATPDLAPDGRLPPQGGLGLAAMAGVAAALVLGGLLLAAL